jgi:anti-sigma factor (TIGR02949 family)
VALYHRPAANKPRAPSGEDETPPASCREVLRSLWDYLDGHCTPALAHRIGGHANACVACYHVRRSQERFFTSLVDVRARSKAPPGLEERVRSALRNG